MSLHSDLISAARKLNGKNLNEFGYFNCFNDNAFKWDEKRDGDAFHAADGNEMKDDGKAKACAAYSSSMFAYNFFSWIGENTPCNINGIDYDERFFEVRIPCLNLIVSRANMDVVLMSKDRKYVLFVESKLTEHLSNASSKMKSISNSYDNPKMYYTKNGELWGEIVKEWRTNAANDNPCSGYFDGIKQEICHRIAIDNLKNIRSDNSAFVKRFHELNAKAKCGLLLEAIKNSAVNFSFASLVFEPSEKYKKEHRLFQDYEKIHKVFSQSFTDENDCSFMTYTGLWNDMGFKAKMPDELKKYLWNRYMESSSAKTL